MRGLARMYDVRMAQFVLKIEKLSHIMGPRGSQRLRSPSPIMAPNIVCDFKSRGIAEFSVRSLVSVSEDTVETFRFLFLFPKDLDQQLLILASS